MVWIATDPRIERLQDLLAHVEHVRQNCETIGVHLIERGDFELGRDLICNGRTHDASKFSGIEWDALGGDDQAAHRLAWEHHVHVNPHHAEFYDGGIHAMPVVYLAEAVADWASRSAEFGSDLREWIWCEGMRRFGFAETDPVFEKIESFLGMLLKKRFDR